MDASKLILALGATGLGTLAFLRLVGGVIAAQRRHLELTRLSAAAQRRREEATIVATPVSSEG